MGTRSIERGRGGAAEQGQTGGAGAALGNQDPLAVQQLTDPLIDPLQASADGIHGSVATAEAPGAGGAVQMTPTNPNELTDGAGADRTTHEDPQIDQGINAPDGNVPDGESTALTVQVIHGEANPLEFTGTPSPEELYETLSTEPVCDVNTMGDTVTTVYGSTTNPGKTYYPEPDAIYIGDMPTTDDIHQGGFANCYFLASVAGAVGQNPGHIKNNVVTGSGEACRVQLYKYQPAAGANPATWTAAPAITTDTTQVHQVDPATGVASYDVLGAKARVADHPSRMEWWCEVLGNNLYVNCNEYYEMALWAPVLEKAYAVYAEQHGQYGGYAAAQANGGASGYERTGGSGGGISQYAYRILYGPNATDGYENTTYAAGSDLVASNLSTIGNLLRLIGVGVGEGRSFQMNALMSRNSAVDRLKDLTDHILGQRRSRRYPGLRRAMRRLKRHITRWENADAADKPARLQRVSRTASRLCSGDNWPLLHRENAPDDYRAFNELANTVANIASDTGGDQRMVYAWHFYTVLSANFVDNAGGALALTQANLATEHGNIDPERSSVRVRNPHGTNEPDPDGEAAPGQAVDGQDEGEFTMTLDQFLRNFSQMQFAQVTDQ